MDVSKSLNLPKINELITLKTSRMVRTRNFRARSGNIDPTELNIKPCARPDKNIEGISKRKVGSTIIFKFFIKTELTEEKPMG